MVRQIKPYNEQLGTYIEHGVDCRQTQKIQRYLEN